MPRSGPIAEFRNPTGVRMLTTTAWARTVLDDYRGGKGVVRREG
jgi:hypothetical protein